ncbi:MAG: Mth938-like domain-containing protein [Casimicrobiaceae bacterium]
MKLHLQSDVAQRVTGIGPGWIRINADEYRQSLVLTTKAVDIDGVASGFDALTAADFSRLLPLEPEIVLFGSGAAQHFPRAGLYRELTDAGIGVEIMDTPAACRTFNILTSEGRRVVALLLLG